MIVYDCFTFFNELDLLNIRLELLQDSVDYHVIVESNLTHSGKEKPYHIEENWETFKKWKNKIIYIKVEQTTEGLSFNKVNRYSPEDASWQLENQQRNGIHCIKDMPSDEDLILIGDVDEIPDPQAIANVKDHIIKGQPLSLVMLFHYYYLNCQNIGYDRYWSGTIACKGVDFKNTLPQEHRNNRNTYAKVPNGGYHFSFLGGAEKIKQKIEAFAHTEYNTEDVKSDENIRLAIEEKKDIFNRPGVEYEVVDKNNYPGYLRDIMIKYPQYVV